MPSRTIRKVIQVHPAEADAISKAFGDADSTSKSILARLTNLSGTLDEGWEGNQKTKFIGELGATIQRIQNILLPSLKNQENKYHTFMAEKVIDVVEYY